MRLIDADALLYDLEIVPLTGDGGVDANDLEEIIKRQPTIEERKKGKWLFTDAAPHRVYCSVCYKTFIPNKEWIAWTENMIPRNYCPHCGARMEDSE